MRPGQTELKGGRTAALTALAPPRRSYINQDGVCYMCLTEKSYPKRLAFNYLEELLKEFMAKYRDEVDTASRPYAFIKFGAPLRGRTARRIASRTARLPGSQTPSFRGRRSCTWTRARSETSTSSTTCAARGRPRCRPSPTARSTLPRPRPTADPRPAAALTHRRPCYGHAAAGSDLGARHHDAEHPGRARPGRGARVYALPSLLPRSHHTHAQASRATVAMARRLRCSRRAAVSGKSEKLRGASKNYVSQARYLNTQALLRKYAPLVFVLLLVFGMLWWRFR